MRDLFDGPVTVEEKVDGSQFSFAMQNGEVMCRSRGVQIEGDAGMFKLAVETAEELSPLLHEGWTYRGEYLAKPKHNALAYSRVPHKHVILWDVDRGDQDYLCPVDRDQEARRIGLESVPVYHVGRVDSFAEIEGYLENLSVLGGQRIEGVVVKNYARFGEDGKTLMGKFVSEAFREVHKKSWKAANPNGKDIKQRLVETYRTEPRWNKAVQHLRERGELTETPADIGPLMREVQKDIEAECVDEIKGKLWDWCRKDVLRSCSAGLAEWYKKQVAVEHFGGGK